MELCYCRFLEPCVTLTRSSMEHYYRWELELQFDLLRPLAIEPFRNYLDCTVLNTTSTQYYTCLIFKRSKTKTNLGLLIGLQFVITAFLPHQILFQIELFYTVTTFKPPNVLKLSNSPTLQFWILIPRYPAFANVASISSLSTEVEEAGQAEERERGLISSELGERAELEHGSGSSRCLRGSLPLTICV